MTAPIPTTPATPAPPQIGLALAAVLLMYTGQMILNPIIAPLSRQIGLAEWQVGVMISLAALTIVLTSQAWGRASLSRGRKPVLVFSLALGAGATAVFAAAAWLGTVGALTGIALWIVLLACRGVAFGVAISAVVPTVQAYITDVTPGERERVAGLAGVGAMQGIAMVAGATAGGLLAAAGLLVPVVVVPVVLAAAAALIAIRLRPEERRELIENPPRISARDPRVWPFLVAGFGMFTALGFIQVIAGFIVQDRFALDARATALVTGIALLGAGVGMVVSQAVIVPRTGWRPGTLLRLGSLGALAGFLLLLPDAGPVAFVGGLLLVGAGLGLAMPCYTAGPTLLMSRAEQGGLAGLLGANTALTFVVAPTAATALYGAWAPAPILVSIALMVAVALFTASHRAFRPSRTTAA